MDLPLPDGPDDRDELAGGNGVVQRMQDRQRLSPAVYRLGNSTQLDHRVRVVSGFSRTSLSIGFNDFQTARSTITAPSGLGWIPSG